MPRSATEDEIQEWCIEHIARTLERRAVDIDPKAKLTRLGLDSATLINLIIAAEEWLEIEVEPEAVYEYRSVNALSGYLASLLQARCDSAARPSGNAHP
jgi:acyl carrier protein